ncbi:MAG: ribosome-binding factor A [Desulfobacteraceae bacterium 4484_190.3]|nr:MAG: ribosome-binding factor A [Desulfobacteraceae bacterium 4484_190.3]
MTSITNFKRVNRVGDLIKAEISDILLKDVRDLRIKHMTITDVKMSDDLRLARIFFVPLGEVTCSDEIMEGLRNASKFFRRELGKRLRLRYIPEITFIYDKSFEYGDRIDRLLAEIEAKGSR